MADSKTMQFQNEAQANAIRVRSLKRAMEVMHRDYSRALTTHKEAGMFAAFALQGLLASPIYAHPHVSNFPTKEEAIGLAWIYAEALVKKMNLIKRDCAAHAYKMKISRYILNHDNIVFVIVDQVVVTVFDLDSKR